MVECLRASSDGCARLDEQASRTRSPSCWPASRSTAPTCRRAASTSTTPSAEARRHRPDLADVLDAVAPVLADGAAAARPAVPADQRHGDGQGRRGLRVLPLVPADLAQRGRRRPERLRGRRPTSSTSAMARRQADWPHAMTAASTHDTKRGEDVRARISVLAEMPDELGRRRSTSCSSWCRCPDPGFGNLLWQAVLGAWPAEPRAAARLRREGDARGRRPDPVDRAGRGLRGRRARGGRRRLRRPRGRAPSSTGSLERRHRPGLEQRARREARHADRARRPRRLPGQRAVGAEPRRPRQPAPGRLRPARRAAQAAAGRRAAAADAGPRRRGRGQAAAHPRRPQRSAATTPSCSTATRRWSPSGPAADHVLAFDRGGAVSRRDPAAGRAGATRRLGRHRAAAAVGRLGRPADRSPLPCRRDGGLRLADLLDRLPRGPAGPRRPPRPRGPRPLRRLGAAAVVAVAERRPTGCVPMERGRATAGGRPIGPEPLGEVDYGYLVDPDGSTSADRRTGPAVAAAAARRARALAHASTRAAHTWGDDGLDRPAARRVGDLRAARRHVHPRGDARRGDRQARPPRVDRRRPRRAAAGQRLQRRARLGLRRRRLVRGARAVRRPGGVPALRRRLPRGRAGRHPGRRLQPPRPVGELPAGVRARTSRRRARTRGATTSTSTARAARRSAPTSSTTCGCGSRTTTSTGCGSTPCTRSRTPRETHLLEEMAVLAARLSAAPAPTADR